MTESDLRHILSKNIKTLRNQRSLSQIELAEKADISIPFLSNIERNIKWPHPKTLVKIAKALDVEVHVLFQKKKSTQSANAQDTIIKFKKDITVSLRKSVTAAINNSIESICTHYIDDITD
ncbi:MAG: helix-turn-helix domain-containing protein [Treponema sp.]|nr:helix-turn-helix domain-containing protein [Treponema sp.]